MSVTEFGNKISRRFDVSSAHSGSDTTEELLDRHPTTVVSVLLSTYNDSREQLSHLESAVKLDEIVSVRGRPGVSQSLDHRMVVDQTVVLNATLRGLKNLEWKRDVREHEGPIEPDLVLRLQPVDHSGLESSDHESQGVLLDQRWSTFGKRIRQCSP